MGALRAWASSAASAVLLSGAASAWQSGQLPPNDDDSSGLIPLGFTFRLFGTDYSALYVNNNGNLTFSSPLSTFTPFAFPSSSGFPMIAPFFADVDTRNGRGTVRYEGTSGYFTVRWDDVGYYDALTADNPDLRNSFSVTLQRNNGIIFQYESMNWTTGDASGGSDGFGGAAATLGLDRGNGVEAVVFRRYASSVVSELDGTTWYFQTDNAELPVPLFKQFTSPWGDDATLGVGDPMRKSGCFVTSAAMLLVGQGHNTDPEKLNAFLDPHMPDDLMRFERIPQDSLFFGQDDEVPGPKLRFRTAGFVVIPTPGPLPPEGDVNLKAQILAQLGAAIDLYGPVILRIPSRNWGAKGFLRSHTHAGVATAVVGDDVALQEPGWSGSPSSLSAYTQYVNAHVASDPDKLLRNGDGQGDGRDFSWLAGSTFSFVEVLTPFSQQILQGSANSPVELVITDALGRRLGYDPTSGVRYREIPGSSYARELDPAPADDGALEPSRSFLPVAFEIGDVVEGEYVFEVFGIASGPWSIEFGLSDPVFGYDPRQHVKTGAAHAGSYQAFVETVGPASPLDRTAPEIACSVVPELVWPASGKMLRATVTVEALDAVTSSTDLVLLAARVVSSEPDSRAGAADLPGDCHGLDGFAAPAPVREQFASSGITKDGRRSFVGKLSLRAEWSGGSDGRLYTIEVDVADAAGNVGTGRCVVAVRDAAGVDLEDAAGTFARVGPSPTLERVFQENRGAKYAPDAPRAPRSRHAPLRR